MLSRTVTSVTEPTNWWKLSIIVAAAVGKKNSFNYLVDD